MVINKVRGKFGIISLVAALSLMGYVSVKEIFSEKINNKQDLLRVAGEEIANIRKENDRKIVYFMNGRTPWKTAASTKLSEDNYLVVFENKKNRVTMRHELYHIFAGHCDKAYESKSWSGFRKFQDEFTANCYSYFGLRL